MSSNICAPHLCKLRTTSTLDKNKALYGPQNMFRSSSTEDLCWNSEGSNSPQSIVVSFIEPASIEKLGFQFQGGFVGLDTSVSITTTNDATFQDVTSSFDQEIREPEDSMALQEFATDATSVPITEVKKLKITFEKSTDFYGRVTVYNLDIWASSAAL